MEVWKIIFPSKGVICRFHVNLPGCIIFNSQHLRDVVLPFLAHLQCSQAGQLPVSSSYLGFEVAEKKASLSAAYEDIDIALLSERS